MSATNLRKLAKGQECKLRLPGCDWGTDTTVLAHLREGGHGGIGMKPSDLNAVHACAPCHWKLDHKRWEIPDVDVLRGLQRTLEWYDANGYELRKVK
jgi:hypothetical protein